MPGVRAALILAELPDADRSAIEQECRQAGFDAVWASTAETGSAKLEEGRFDALLVHLTTPGAARVCLNARGKLTHGRFPVIALVEDLDDTNFNRAFRAGADDAVRIGGRGQIERRLGAAPRPSVLPPGRAHGEALIVDPDRARSEILERLLGDAGYRVEAVSDELAAKLQFGRPGVRLIIADSAIGEIRPLVELARRKNARAIWVVRSRPDELKELSHALRIFKHVAVVSAYGPPDDVLFEANRLLDTTRRDHRADPRLLHATTVIIRNPGAEDECGFSYNVGPTGLYVRTLALPQGETASLELSPPDGTKPLTVEGQISWRRSFGPTDRDFSPPGFAVHLNGGELEQWADAVRAAWKEIHGTELPASPARPPPKPSKPAMTAVSGDLSKTTVGLGPSTAGAAGASRAVRPSKQTYGGLGPTLATAAPPKTVRGVAPSDTPAGPSTLRGAGAKDGPGFGEPKLRIPTPAQGMQTQRLGLDRPAVPPPKPAKATSDPTKTPAGQSAHKAATANETSEPDDKDRSKADKSDATAASPPPGSAREKMASVEDLLSDVLGTHTPSAHDSGAIPLTFKGGFDIAENETESVVPDEQPAKNVATAAPTVPRPDADASPGVGADSERISVAPDELLPSSHDTSSHDASAHDARSPALASTLLSIDKRDVTEPARQPARSAAPANEPTAVDATKLDAALAFVDGAALDDDFLGTATTQRPPAPESEAPPANGAQRVPFQLPLEAKVELPKPWPPPADEVVQRTPAPGATSTDVPSITPPRTRKRGPFIAAAFVVGGLIAGGIFALRGVQSTPEPALPAPETPTTPISAAAPTTAAPQTPPPAPEPTVAPTPTAAPEPKPEPTATQTAAPPQPSPPSPAPVGQPAPSAAPANEPAEIAAPSEPLKPGFGYLYVESAIDTNVFVHGMLVGKTNTMLTAYCGNKFIRLGDAPGQWKSEGVPFKVVCGETSRLRLP